MGKSKGLSEDQIEEVAVEIEDCDAPSEESADAPVSASDYMQAAGTPDETLKLVQGIRVSALTEMAATLSATELAEQARDLLTATAQTATQQLRAEAEAKKGEGNAELAKAIAQNNSGLVFKKRADESAPSSNSNPTKDRKISFDSKVDEIEVSEENEAPEYDELMKIADEINGDKGKES